MRVSTLRGGGRGVAESNQVGVVGGEAKEVAAQVAAQKGRVDAVISEHQQQFSSAQGDRGSQFLTAEQALHAGSPP